MNAIKIINEIVIDAIQQGFIPWKTFHLGFPTNVFTNKKYSGINPILLQISAHKNKFKRSHYWGSLQQWKKVQCCVSFNQEPTSIFIFQELEEKGEDRKFPSLKKVYNAVQAYGLSIGNFMSKKNSSDYSQVENLLKKSDVVIKEGLNPLYYNGTITMPHRSFFKNDAQYWSAYLHELCHHWELKVGFSGDQNQRELVAEIASGYLEGILGLEQCTDRGNHDKYLGQWLEEAKKNPKYFSQSATIANRIVYSLMNLLNPKEFPYAE